MPARAAPPSRRGASARGGRDDSDNEFYDDGLSGTHDDWDDAPRSRRAPARHSDDFEDAADDFEDDYDDEYARAPRERANASRSGHSRRDEEPYSDEYTDEYDDEYDDDGDDDDEPVDDFGGAAGSARNDYSDAPRSASGRDRHAFQVEHPHTDFADVQRDQYPEPKELPFNPDEPAAKAVDSGDFPAFFSHRVADYGEFGVLSRIYLELRQLMMFGITTLGLMIVVNLAFMRYLNPFRKHYPKAKVDTEFNRRITGERYSERVEYYAEYWGYKCEEYEVTTRGGWILKVHRISDPRRPGGRGYPVILQHGILCTSLFFFTSEERSLGFWLVDRGFDVWSSNIRSNYGAGHTRYKRWDPRFWAWGLVELGDDLKDLVDYVLDATGYRQLAFVGHSQGTGSMFLALNKYPEFGHKLSSFTALGPAVYPGSSLNRLPFRVMKLAPSRWAWSLLFGVREFMPALDLSRKILPKVLMGHLGYIIFGYLFDFHDHNWVDRHKPKVFCSTGVTTSSELLYYWIHSFVYRGCVFDPRITRPWFGPSFPPLTVVYGTIDNLVVGKPLAERLLKYESNVQIVHFVELQGYEHMDMVLGVDAYKTVFPKILDTIERTIDPEDVPEAKAW